MALEELIARLERDALARVARVEASAAAEAGTLLAEAARRREDAVRTELSARRASMIARFEGELARARQRSRAERLGAQRAVVEQVLARARELCDEVGRSPAYAAAVARQAARALRYVEGLEVTVRARPELQPALRAVAPALELDLNLGFGFVVTARDGSVTIDETLAARLERLAGRLAVVLKKELVE